MTQKVVGIVIIIILLAGLSWPLLMKKSMQEESPTPVPFYGLSAQNIDGALTSMEQFRGKYVLIVNTASRCGYTSQLKELEQLAQQYKNKLVVLGFPSNDFLWQEPKNNHEIKEFCTLNYHTTFPLFEKVSVKKGKNQSPIYRWLTDPKQNGWNKKGPSWNFNKYIIDPHGKLIARFDAGVSPLSRKITDLFK